MSEQSNQRRVGLSWKWIGLGGVVIVAIIWAGLHLWGTTQSQEAKIGGGTAPTTTMSSNAAVSTGSFNFDDRASELGKYVGQASQLVKDGYAQEAIDYMNNLLAALDLHIQKMENKALRVCGAPTTQTQQGTPVEPPEVSALRVSRYRKIIAELTLANIKALSGGLSEKDWITCYEKAFQDYKQDANYIGWILIYTMTPKELPGEKVKVLVKDKNLPAGLRGRLALWIWRYQQPGDKATTAQCREFYEELLAHVSDTVDGSLILTDYVVDLDKRKETSLIREILENYISLFYDSEIGYTAVGFFVSHEPNEAGQNEQIVKYYEKYPNSYLANKLRYDYAQVLAERCEYSKAIETIDTEREIKKARTPQDVADLVMKYAKMVSSPKVSAFTICTKFSQDFLTNSNYAGSAALSFAALKSVSALPNNLITQRPIRKISEVIDMDDPANIQLAAEYLQACILEKQKSNSKSARELLDKMRTEKCPSSFEPYILCLLIDDAVSSENWELARTYAGKALEQYPASTILIDLQNQLDHKYQQAKARSRIETEKKNLLEDIKKAQIPDEAIKGYKKLADLYLATNNMEQAVGIYLQIVNKYPKHPLAPSCLADTILLLEQTNKKKYEPRIKSLIERLKKEYPSSPETKRISESLHTFN